MPPARNAAASSTEARDLRASVLGDLAERRRSLRVQLEQLRTGRDSLLGVVDAVGDAVDQLRDRLANGSTRLVWPPPRPGTRVEARGRCRGLFPARR